MANKVQTVFQRLENVFNGNGDSRQNINAHRNTYDLSNHTVFSTTDKDKYEEKKLEMQQNKYLSDRWVKANSNLSLSAFAGLSNVKLMYRDADLMDAFPEIGAALDIYAEESCLNNQNGQTINVYSSSDRTKNILEDLFVNRLDLQMTAPMVIRAMCKYGNQFMLLNTDRKNGICGWKQLPVFNVERVENGVINPYGMATLSNNGKPEEKDLSTKFIWTDDNNTITPYRNWQIGHFRLLTNSIFLPYGVSILNPARRHWRMLSLMEDMMLIYRLERSVERRVYKIFVGAIDNADVPAYIEEIANQFKRTQIVDPMTGQIDLRKNILGYSDDIFIPTRSENAPNPIDTLPAGNNLTAMDDIKFVQNKVLTALRMPKTFLNFEEAAGDGKNLALMDVRFTRTINRIQQAFLTELTKIASIHLYLLGFEDEITNFSLSMRNPSTQAEQLEIENISKKIAAVRDAVSDPGNGIPVYSWTRALKEIMHLSDSEIKTLLEELRLEKAIAQELQNTPQIIQKTGVFDNVDRVYGEPNATYQGTQQGQQGEEGGFGGGGGGGLGGDFGGGLDDLGGMGGEGAPDVNGEEGAMPMDQMGGGGEGAPEAGGGEPQAGGEEKPPMEAVSKNKPLILESGLHSKDIFEKILEKKNNDGKNIEMKRPKMFNKALKINEEYNKMISEIDSFIGEK